MNKKSILFVAVVCLLAMITSCSQQSGYEKAIPANATVVTSINAKSLAEKADLGNKSNKEALNKLSDAMKKGMSASTYQLVEEIIKDANKSGIDFKMPIYIFASPDFKSTPVIAKVSDAANLIATVEAMENEKVASTLAEGDGYQYSLINSRVFMGFNTTTLLITEYWSNSQLEQIKTQTAALFKQDDNAAISSKATFKQMNELDGDIKIMVANLTEMYNTYANQTTGLTPEDIDISKISIIGDLSFEKGKIVCNFNPYSEDEKLMKLLKEKSENMYNIENSFLKYFPKSTLSLLSMGVNGKEVYNQLTSIPEVKKNLSLENSKLLEAVCNAVDGDVTFGLTNVSMSNQPAFLMHAELKDASVIDQICEQMGNEIAKLDEHEYVYKDRKFNVFFGVRDKLFYLTNDETTYKNIGKAADPSVKEKKYTSDFSGHKAAFVIDIKAIMQLPAVKMLLSYASTGENSYIQPLCEKLDYFICISNEQNGATLTLQLTDKDTNALKQAIDAAMAYAGM